MERRTKHVLAGAASLVAAALIGYGFLPEPIDVDVTAAARGPLQVTLSEEGRTRIAQRFTISAPVSGFAPRTRWKVGDIVERGTVLLHLQPLRSELLDPRRAAQARAQLDATRAGVAAAEERARAAAVDAELARTELNRISNLHAEGSATTQRLNVVEADAERALAHERAAAHAVATARAEAASAEAALRSADAPGTVGEAVSSPADGTVLTVFHESEGIVQAGQPLLEIGNPDSLEVEIDVLSSDAVRIDPGTRVVFTRWGGQETLEGRVHRVEPIGFTRVSALGVEEQRVRVIAELTSPHPVWQRLGHGYRVEADFVLWEDPDVLCIPSSALFQTERGWAVFTVRNRRAYEQRVDVGQRSGLTAEISGGLRTGDRVITHPDDRLEEGVRVNTNERDR